VAVIGLPHSKAPGFTSPLFGCLFALAFCLSPSCKHRFAGNFAPSFWRKPGRAHLASFGATQLAQGNSGWILFLSHSQPNLMLNLN